MIINKNIQMALLNLIWPGYGYYHAKYKENGLKVMVGYFLLVFILIALNSPNMLIIGFLVYLSTVFHPLLKMGFIKSKNSDDKVLKEYTKETLKTISSNMDRLFQEYTDLKSKLGGDNKEIKEMRGHIDSLRIHYTKAKNSFNQENYKTATDEATFSYKMISCLESDVKRLNEKYLGFQVLK